MKKTRYLSIPVRGALRKLGADIHDARRRRRITMALLAERAGISRITLGKIQKGDPSASMGAYAAVLFSLGMIERLRNLLDVSSDRIGLQLLEEELPQRVRIPKRYRTKKEEKK